MATKVLADKVCKECASVYTPTARHQKWCVGCKKTMDYKRIRNWLFLHPEKIKEYSKRYREKHIEQVRERDRQYNQTPKRRKYLRENDRRYRRKNREKYNARQRKWAKDNKDYVYFMNKKRLRNKKKTPGSHSFEEWVSLKHSYDFTCPACLRSEPEISLTEDHIIPLVKGGTDWITNIQPLCGECNGKKYTKKTYYEIV